MQPKTFLVGVTQPDFRGLSNYLTYTGQTEFLDQFNEAYDEFGSICLASFYAKLCYKSLVLGKNENVNKIRDVEKNIKGCFDVGHGSVFEHVWMNFITTDCSRVFTHELVRHRVGTAFSQTSGRYVAIGSDMKIVLPPAITENPECMSIVEDIKAKIISAAELLRHKLITKDMHFDLKKKLTSAIRRIAPNGQTNDIGWSCNIRTLRHLLEMRTSRHAEWEIRVVFAEVASIVEERWPLMLHGGKKEMIDDLPEYTNLRV